MEFVIFHFMLHFTLTFISFYIKSAYIALIFLMAAGYAIVWIFYASNLFFFFLLYVSDYLYLTDQIAGTLCVNIWILFIKMIFQ